MLFVCDMHIHIGSAGNRQAVKVTASKDLTFANIAKEAAERKGIDVVGIIDCASPRVIADIEEMIETGEMLPLDGGGLRYRDAVTVILGSEIETREPGGGMSHHCSYFPDIKALKAFSAIMEQYITNVNLSSQACGLSAVELFGIAEGCDGVMVPAHCFTPHKSPYGACVERMAKMFGDAWERIPAIELGLSADAFLANLGSLSSDGMGGLLPTARAALAHGVPWVLDPTAIGAAPVRTRLAGELLDLGPTVVRGNASEVVTLAGGTGRSRGADSTAEPGSAGGAAHRIAAHHGCVVAVSGAVDLVTDGTRTVRLSSGAPALTRVAGTGCLLGALTAAHLAVAAPFVGAVAATAWLTIASERVGHLRPGSFRIGLLDALDEVTPSEVAEGVDLSWE